MKTLQEYADKYPALTFQNNGYEYINKDKLTDEERKAFEEVSELLKVKAGSSATFFNFNKSSSGVLQVRYDAPYDPMFIGVYYTPVSEVDSWEPDNKDTSNE